MKKTLLAIFALATMTASAVSLQNYTHVFVPASKAHFTESAIANPAQKAPKKIANVDELLGDYILQYTPMDENDFPGANKLNVAKGTKASSITLQGLFAPEASEKVTAIVDAENNTFTIAPGQTIYTSQSYGACSIYKVTGVAADGSITLDKNANIEGVIENGMLKINTSWACIINAGQYAGYNFIPIHKEDVAARPNGKMEYTNSKNQTINETVLITEEEDSIITVSNFADIGFVVKMVAQEDSTVLMPKQNVFDGGQEQGIFYTTDIVGSSGQDAQPDDYIVMFKANTSQEISSDEQWTFMSDAGYWFGINKKTKIYFTNDEEFRFPGSEPNGVNNVTTSKTAVKTTYVNLAGVESDEPFEGVNIVLTRYTDGTTQAKKVLK